MRLRWAAITRRPWQGQLQYLNVYQSGMLRCHTSRSFGAGMLKLTPYTSAIARAFCTRASHLIDSISPPLIRSWFFIASSLIIRIVIGSLVKLCLLRQQLGDSYVPLLPTASVVVEQKVNTPMFSRCSALALMKRTVESWSRLVH